MHCGLEWLFIPRSVCCSASARLLVKGHDSAADQAGSRGLPRPHRQPVWQHAQECRLASLACKPIRAGAPRNGSTDSTLRCATRACRSTVWRSVCPRCVGRCSPGTAVYTPPQGLTGHCVASAFLPSIITRLHAV